LLAARWARLVWARCVAATRGSPTTPNATPIAAGIHVLLLLLLLLLLLGP
jgi:hypothetical protein